VLTGNASSGPSPQISAGRRRSTRGLETTPEGDTQLSWNPAVARETYRMTLVATRELIFTPSYKLFSIRDYGMVDQPGAGDARTTAYRDVVGSSECEIFIVCAQDQLKVRLTVAIHDEPSTVQREPWQDTRRFILPFPTAHLHAGDEFGNVINLNLPVTGPWAVTVQYRGRSEAVETLKRIWPQAAALPLPQTMEELEKYAAIEEYAITLFPSAGKREV
jgi:hypothetical protein